MDQPVMRTPRTSLTKAQLQDPAALDLLALLQTVTADGKVLDAEVQLLKQWLDDHAASTIPAVAYLRDAAVTVLADGRVTPEERSWLQRAIETVLPREEREVAALRRREAVADKRREAASKREQQAEIRRRSRPIATFDFMAAGVSYEGRANIVARFVAEDDDILLVREPNNRYSPNAIILRLENGHEIGYVPEIEAVRLAPLLNRGARQSAAVKKILTGGRVPIPVIWGELYASDAPVANAAKPELLPARRSAPPVPVFRSPTPAPKSGCLPFALVALFGAALLLLALLVP